jgi:hypothetical protein
VTLSTALPVRVTGVFGEDPAIISVADAAHHSAVAIDGVDALLERLANIANGHWERLGLPDRLAIGLREPLPVDSVENADLLSCRGD